LWDPRLEDAAELEARGGRWERLGQWRWAAADYRAAVARRLDSFRANHAPAWLLAEAPARGDLEEAVRLAQVPDDQLLWILRDRQRLALALYRAGRFAEAATVAEFLYRLPWAGTSRLVLAMSRQRLGQAAAARAALAEAVRWRAATTNFRGDPAAVFDRLLRDARSVVNEALPNLPADVFAPGNEPTETRINIPLLQRN
jgi:hypothetical protein